MGLKGWLSWFQFFLNSFYTTLLENKQTKRFRENVVDQLILRSFSVVSQTYLRRVGLREEILVSVFNINSVINSEFIVIVLDLLEYNLKKTSDIKILSTADLNADWESYRDIGLPRAWAMVMAIRKFTLLIVHCWFSLCQINTFI